MDMFKSPLLIFQIIFHYWTYFPREWIKGNKGPVAQCCPFFSLCLQSQPATKGCPFFPMKIQASEKGSRRAAESKDYYVALVRALLTLEGIALTADCDFDIFEASCLFVVVSRSFFLKAVFFPMFSCLPRFFVLFLSFFLFDIYRGAYAAANPRGTRCLGQVQIWPSPKKLFFFSELRKYPDPEATPETTRVVVVLQGKNPMWVAFEETLKESHQFGVPENVPLVIQQIPVPSSYRSEICFATNLQIANVRMGCFHAPARKNNIVFQPQQHEPEQTTHSDNSNAHI